MDRILRNITLWMLLLPGCKCPDWEDIRVSDKTDTLSETNLDHIRSEISTFARCTLHDSVCVSKVRIVDEIDLKDGDVAGVYRPNGTIEIEAGSYTDDILRHELCHALDRAEDYSVDNPTLFDAATVEESDLYPTDKARTREAFARTCEIAPSAGVGVTRWLADNCQSEALDEGLAFVYDEVYEGFDGSYTKLFMTEQKVSIVESDLWTDIWIDGSDVWLSALVSSGDTEISRHRLSDGAKLSTFLLPTWAYFFSSDKGVALSSGDGEVWYWDGTQFAVGEAMPFGLPTAMVEGDGQVYISDYGSEDPELRAWDPRDWTEVPVAPRPWTDSYSMHICTYPWMHICTYAHMHMDAHMHICT